MNKPLPSLNTSKHSSFSTPLRLLLATTAALWMGASQAQVPATTVPRQVSDLRFREFFNTPTDPTGLKISDTLRLADGQAVRLVGYMVQQDKPTPGRFMLAPRPAQMTSNPDGNDTNNLPPATVVVLLDPSQQAWVLPHVDGLIRVNGTLSIGQQEEHNALLPLLHLQLDTEIALSTNAFELTGYLHRPT